MNRNSYSDQTCQLVLKEQSNVQCPLKPKIPYAFENTFYQDFGQASYLTKQSTNCIILLQPSDHLKHNKLQINNNDRQCCEKFEQASQYYESTLQSQIVTMFQLNELIDQHSNLLETYLEKQKIHIDKQKLQLFIKKKITQVYYGNRNGSNRISQINKEIKKQSVELKKKIKHLEETLVRTDIYSITQELESWKSKYQNLTKIHQETAEKLKGFEIELEQLNQNSSVDESQLSKKTTEISTRRRQTKKVELMN